MIISHFPGGGSLPEGKFTAFAYSGSYELTDDATRIRLKSSGTLTVYQDIYVDVFLVGGGGGGGAGYSAEYTDEYNPNSQYQYTHDDHDWGGGGGGGYTETQSGIVLPEGTYTVTIGAGGASSSDGGTTQLTDGDDIALTAAGGKGGNGIHGGDGGNGGAAGSYWYDSTPTTYNGSPTHSDGDGTPGTSQEGNTRAFGEEDGEEFSAGGAKGNGVPGNGAANTGNGGQGGNGYRDGNGGTSGGTGGSGIIIIRSAEVA